MTHRSLEAGIQSIAELSRDASDLLICSTRQKPLAKGQVLLPEGQVCKTIWYVEKGYLRTFYNKDGKEINTRFSFENEFVTDLKSLRSGAPSACWIQAGEATVVWEFAKVTLLDLYRQSAEIESFGRNLLEQMLVDQEDHANLFRIHSPTERYAYVVRHFPQLLQRVSLSQLSSYLGMARETVSRIRKNR
ncbi:Crp/Fnr family transcriptional regulator [Larkinella humicola]|uniref:Crp/Fnr family transcriptional regulator n=1 Tax=Larkinella humicola TaxID=2607654 RepID=A0A5N1J7D2_9BACT|nr:Crp/Fnr family transcriptional regulator [Larkinella humicola]KAA9346715.1 Crp/Fnr family transcriptional regulator [Larkinella humicola]